MTERTDTLTFATTTELEAAVAVEGSWSVFTSFVVAGLQINRSASNDLFYVKQYLGESNVPGDIRRLRRSVHELMRRMGQPVIVKHMFNDRDARIGLAQPSPATNSIYKGQVRNRDPFSYGTGYCSIEQSEDEWINPETGAIVTSESKPGVTYIPAPKYRGYGPGYLTYLIEPDVPLDLFKLSPAGAIIKIQSQTVVSSWFPEINDNDLLINVELDDEGNVFDTGERYQAKITNPISIRGRDNRGRREYGADHGNRHVVNQQFQMNRLPTTSVLFQVESDR